MNFDYFVLTFVLVAGLERVWEMRWSQRAMRGHKAQSWTFIYFATLHVVIFAGTAVEHFLMRRLVVWTTTWVALAVFAGSLALRLAAIRTLGRYWSLHLEIRQEHKLITGGIYQYMRHPAYTAIMAEVVSFPLVAGAYWMALLGLAGYVPVLLWRWWREEGEMVAKFGETYRAYQRAVPAFLPLRGRCDFEGLAQVARDGGLSVSIKR